MLLSDYLRKYQGSISYTYPICDKLSTFLKSKQLSNCGRSIWESLFEDPKVLTCNLVLLSELCNRNKWKVSSIAAVYVTIMDIDTCISRYSGTIALRCWGGSVFSFPIVIVPANIPLGILESTPIPDDAVHLISVTSSLLRSMVYSS